ncbi:hypothetical protein DVS77_12330 [Mycolicibacterium moriokaense]|nr:hypothetical protein DVS77_12330 [Mycolicibacterium moriokaense]
MSTLEGPFIGSEALEQGLVRKHELRRLYRRVFPDIYLAKSTELTLAVRARAGWLWSHREGVIAGLTASALHGAKWVDDSAPVELVWSNARPARGLRTADVRVARVEIEKLAGMRVTTPARTAFDIARRRPLHTAVANLDALGNATGLTAQDVLAVARRHRGSPGLRQLPKVLDLYDAGAASPRETWLRLLVIRADYPRPRTQIPVVSADGRRNYYLDMGWQDMMLALEYDGEHHRLDPDTYAYDIRRSEDLAELGWTRLRVVKANSAADVLRRLDHVWRSKLQTDREIS